MPRVGDDLTLEPSLDEPELDEEYDGDEYPYDGS
tara:strand:+ start:2028 stop:2129 length:102 start_codon:yes stop_codon:yes gene_type:complete